jgi:hypothetical protein
VFYCCTYVLLHLSVYLFISDLFNICINNSRLSSVKRQGQLVNKKVKSLSMPWRHVTLPLGGCEWPLSRPGRFIPGKEHRYPLNSRRSGSHNRSGRFWRRGNLLSLPRFKSRTVQSLAGRHTNYAVPAPWLLNTEMNVEGRGRGLY